ncbi:hypothetical protein JK628_03005 [Shewanella sp. KX20019]|uniref:hypothetical protein n=1 Tax=Shewanella sp. KX20019 TaxID=2803864 RepID=UPI0019297F16|nr:hypothetical protein [Shewanella sp. KX20019]QQX80859.1 hypothetical protein JK628_03005 [Shewanella sp. KX20019]
MTLTAKKLDISYQKEIINVDAWGGEIHLYELSALDHMLAIGLFNDLGGKNNEMPEEMFYLMMGWMISKSAKNSKGEAIFDMENDEDKMKLLAVNPSVIKTVFDRVLVLSGLTKPETKPKKKARTKRR